MSAQPLAAWATSLISRKTSQKRTLESDKFYDAVSPGRGGLFSKSEDVTARTSRKVPPRRPAHRLRIGRTESRWSFSGSNPAALLGSCAGITAEEVSFLKRDPHGRAERFNDLISRSFMRV
jgi:hypothetical protein